MDYIPAKDVKLSDQFYILIDDRLEQSSVMNITIELKTGYFAPLTMTGNFYLLRILLK